MKDVLLNNVRVQGNWNEDSETISKILNLLNRYDFYYLYIDNYGQMMEQKEKNVKIESELRELGVTKFNKL